jgi:hypothetical protein
MRWYDEFRVRAIFWNSSWLIIVVGLQDVPLNSVDRPLHPTDADDMLKRENDFRTDPAVVGFQQAVRHSDLSEFPSSRVPSSFVSPFLSPSSMG